VVTLGTYTTNMLVSSKLAFAYPESELGVGRLTVVVDQSNLVVAHEPRTISKTGTEAAVKEA
jgi:hypothetical protein